MSKTRPLAIGLVLLPLVGCAGLNDDFLAPLEPIEPGAGPLDPASAATAEAAAGEIRSGVITGDLLVGGEAAGRMLAAPEVMPAAGPEGEAPDSEAEEVVAGESAEADEVRRTAAYERLPAARQSDSRNLTQQSLLLERWMSSRIETAELTRNDIRRAQQLLADLGYEPGPIDGFMGPRTRAAVEAFEEAQGLTASGEITPALIDRLAIERG